MNIGFDSKRAFCNNTGLGNYSRTLISSLEEYCKNCNLILFTPKRKLEFHTQSTIIEPQIFLSKLFNSYWRSKIISRKAKQYNLDLYHGLSHEIPFAMHKKVKTLVTIHDLIYLTRPKEFSLIDRKVYDKKFRYACNNAHAIVAITNETKKDIIKYFNIPAKKIYVIYQSCDSIFRHVFEKKTLIKFRKKYSLPKDYLLFIGSMNPRKKPLELVKAYHKISNQTNWPLIMIGSGKEKAKIIDFIIEHNLQQKITFLKIKSNEELAMLYQCASIFTFPSVNEGFGIPIIEAQFSKTCVLTSSFSCLPEVAGPGAIYTNPNDLAQFSQSIITLINDKRKREESVKISFQWVQKYSQENIANEYIKLYKSLLY